jgi:deazaflavin-dependent oxidoreductase (nitroreductase family)
MRLSESFVAFADKANQWVYRISDGRIGGQLLKYSMLLLETTGRKTGLARTHTLLYVRDGENMVVIASNNGQDRYPDWYHNLKAKPLARVRAGRHWYTVHSWTVEGEEDYQRLWLKFLQVRPQYAEYHTRTTRPFPIIVLKPVITEQ